MENNKIKELQEKFNNKHSSIKIFFDLDPDCNFFTLQQNYDYDYDVELTFNEVKSLSQTLQDAVIFYEQEKTNSD